MVQCAIDTKMFMCCGFETMLRSRQIFSALSKFSGSAAYEETQTKEEKCVSKLLSARARDGHMIAGIRSSLFDIVFCNTDWLKQMRYSF